MNKKISSVGNLSMVINQSQINVAKINSQDYICLTDMAKSAGAERALHSWLRTKNTIDFLGFWEQLNNPEFKVHEFVYFKNNAGANNFNPSIIEWIEKTNAKGIVSKRGRYGGTYAHKDIAFEFGTWLSPEFKLLIITEFQRLKAKEQKLDMNELKKQNIREKLFSQLSFLFTFLSYPRKPSALRLRLEERESSKLFV